MGGRRFARARLSGERILWGTALGLYTSVSRALVLGKWQIGQWNFVYDINEVELDCIVR